MNTKEQIIQLADCFIREKGFNAFSFYDISNKIEIKTASIHYHFPTKSDLGVAVIEYHIEKLNKVINDNKLTSPMDKLDRFFSIYKKIKNENKVCLVGSLATDFNTLDEKVKKKLKEFSEIMLSWVSEFLEDGRKKDIFDFEGESRTKALMIISNMLAIVQLSRLTTQNDFEVVKKSIQRELIK
ncbi:TetR/AcrR family transcriptional regulator [Stygiobacter electus]|uniref:TetR/AcrR family transcriptional regulator n=1 Tax=Stygiobacter electus TaxID=3032292 RepID=A0AAE3P2I3_9BACT|nr:TetR/AcrR family transcriptional regulator [Stygiobacter electus]MDF1613229.1 TetR/AcrR family transcriptional regulator [Stygiobacter electus]